MKRNGKFEGHCYDFTNKLTFHPDTLHLINGNIHLVSIIFLRKIIKQILVDINFYIKVTNHYMNVTTYD